MAVIGVDTHKATLAACAIDTLGHAIDEREFGNDPAGHDAFVNWVGGLSPERIGVEGSSSYGAAVARNLICAGFEVREVPPHLSRRERIRTRRAGKSDAGDALAIARVTAREGELPPVRVADRAEEIGLLLLAREDLVAEATRIRNRLHADLLLLLPGYSGTLANLVARRHLNAVSASLRPQRGVRVELARLRVARLRLLGSEAAALEQRLRALLAGNPLLDVPGVGVLTAAKLIAEIGDVGRFRSADAFAMLAGVAPIPASSGQRQRLRLNRGGNRQLNRALYSIALVQASFHPPAKLFIARKRAEGKTWREAIRALKRHLARVVFRIVTLEQQAARNAA
jgi:transposase